jgi:hypothetical protein
VLAGLIDRLTDRIDDLPTSFDIVMGGVDSQDINTRKDHLFENGLIPRRWPDCCDNLGLATGCIPWQLGTPLEARTTLAFA